MPKLIDLTGQQFGYLQVLERGENVKDGNSSRPGWKCRCLLCGNIKTISGRNLRQGGSTTCGCTRGGKLLKNEIGNKYGKLTVIERAENNARGLANWICKCECGSKTVVAGNNLRNGLTKSCGCVRSRGELEVRQELLKRNIDFVTEYSFEDLLTDKYYPCRFDFAIFKNNKLLFLLEYQGAQHYLNTNFGKEQREQTDIKKKEYCKEKNIKLYEIKYNEDIVQKLDEIIKREC